MSIEKLEIQEKVDARERAQGTCPVCGCPTERQRIADPADPTDTISEEVCLGNCKWRV